MSAYTELQKRQTNEINEFPIAYAFNKEQLEEALVKLGATKDECCTIFERGDIVKKTDAKRFVDMLKRHTKEVQELLKDKGEAYKAFLHEMDNHEYCINWSGDEDVLACFGMEIDDLDELDLRDVYIWARREHMRKAHEEWEII